MLMCSSFRPYRTWSSHRSEPRILHVATIMQDGDLTEGSRWSCSPSLGGDCTISYDLGAERDLYELRLGKEPM